MARSTARLVTGRLRLEAERDGVRDASLPDLRAAVLVEEARASTSSGPALLRRTRSSSPNGVAASTTTARSRSSGWAAGTGAAPAPRRARRASSCGEVDDRHHRASRQVPRRGDARVDLAQVAVGARRWRRRSAPRGRGAGADGARSAVSGPEGRRRSPRARHAAPSTRDLISATSASRLGSPGAGGVRGPRSAIADVPRLVAAACRPSRPRPAPCRRPSSRSCRPRRSTASVRRCRTFSASEASIEAAIVGRRTLCASASGLATRTR